MSGDGILVQSDDHQELFADKDTTKPTHTGEADNIYVIERLLGKKKQKKKTYYLVKWKDFDHAEATWEPMSALPKALINAFNAEQRKVKQE